MRLIQEKDGAARQHRPTIALALALLLAAMPVSRAAVIVGTNQVVNVGLAWDQSPDPTVTGYRIYYGVASRIYTNSVNAPGITNATALATNCIANTKYYFAATAYNASGLESAFSNEISYTPTNQPPTNPPTNLRVTFQMQAGTNPNGPFANLAGAVVTVTNQVNPLIPGFFYKTLITSTTITP